jgi:hypothetical protein
MRGYASQPAATSGMWSDGWLDEVAPLPETVTLGGVELPRDDRDGVERYATVQRHEAGLGTVSLSVLAPVDGIRPNAPWAASVSFGTYRDGRRIVCGVGYTVQDVEREIARKLAVLFLDAFVAEACAAIATAVRS